MPQTTTGWALLTAVALFVAFIVTKSLVRFRLRDDEEREGRAQIIAAKKRARAAQSPDEKAEAYREAARVALETLDRPRLSARFALRAEKLSPSAGEKLGWTSTVLVRAGRLRALEAMLWRHLAECDGDALMDARRELVALYDGPMKKPLRAKALQRWSETPGC